MSKAVKKYQTSEIADFKNKLENHLEETNQDINLACDESIKIQERDFWELLFANNTKDLALISERHSLIHKKLLRGDALNTQLSMEVIRTNKEIINKFKDTHIDLIENFKGLKEDTYSEFQKNKIFINEEVVKQQILTDSKIKELKTYSSEKIQENEIKLLLKIKDIEKRNSELSIQVKRFQLLSLAVLAFSILTSLASIYAFILK